MFLTKLKIATAGTLVLAVLGAGAVGLSSPQLQLAEQAQPTTKVQEYPVGTATPTGILVLDNCDEQYQGKEEYKDNLTLLDLADKQMFRVSGFNNCESIGSSHMIAADLTRKCIWVIENVAHRIRRFDLTGKETLTIPGVHGSAIAIDPETGNVWALAGEGMIGAGKTCTMTRAKWLPRKTCQGGTSPTTPM